MPITFTYLTTYYDEYASPIEKVPSGVLVGQLGIGESACIASYSPQSRAEGKSFWIYYAARRCAAERKPFIWFFKVKYYLFVSEGVYYLFVSEGVYRLLYDWTHDDLCIVCTLVDSDQCKDGVPPSLFLHGVLLFIIYATYPALHRWSRMDKTMQSVVVIMNPWGRKEIKRA
jgi:hypothetical protein